MIKSLFAVGAVSALLAVAPAGAAAAPDGQGLDRFPATCGGEAVTVTTGSGASFWIGEQKYALTELSGTFTPSDGGDPQSFTKEYGNRTGKTGTPIHCTGSISDPGGTFEFHAIGVPIR